MTFVLVSCIDLQSRHRSTDLMFESHDSCVFTRARPILSADYSHQKTIGNRPKVGRLTPMFTVIFSLLKCWECVVFAVSLQRYLFKKLYFFCLFYFYLGQINKKPFCTSYFCSNCMLLVTIFIIKTFCNGKMFCLQFIYW